MGSKKVIDKRRSDLQRLLREMRLAAGLNQVELAERLGTDQSFVSRFERGERRLDLIELADICASCGRDLAQLVQLFQQGIGNLATTRQLKNERVTDKHGPTREATEHKS